MGAAMGYQRASVPRDGISGLSSAITSMPGRAMDLAESGINTGKYVIIAVVVMGGGVLLMLAYSFASGKQDLAATAGAVADVAKMATPAGRVASVAQSL